MAKSSSSYRRFSQLLEDIPVSEGRLQVLKCLVEKFPNEAHFWGHLARFFSVDLGQPNEALDAVEEAIRLSPDDHVLYHMKGMCIRAKLYNLMSQCKQSQQYGAEQLGEIQKLVAEAGQCFRQTREIAQDNEFGYISDIQMSVRVIEFGFSMSKVQKIEEFLSSQKSTWYLELLDNAETLLESVSRLREGEKPDKFVIQCQAGISTLYEDYNSVIQRWNSLLDNKDIYAPPVRRQLVRAYVARNKNSWENLSQKDILRLSNLLEQNIMQEPQNGENVRLWLLASRHSSQQTVDKAIEKLTYWRTNTGTLESSYYLYILYVIKALDGSTIAANRATDLIGESKQKSQRLRNRNFCIEFYGDGNNKTDMKQLVNYKQLGEVEEKTKFYANPSQLALLTGRISKVDSGKAGYIELPSGLEVFFVPQRGSEEGYSSADRNKTVKFYLGFSYSGLRAWSVKDA